MFKNLLKHIAIELKWHITKGFANYDLIKNDENKECRKCP